MINKLIKEAAELYALGAISIEQLEEGLTYAELQDALIYSEYYGGKYDQCLRYKEEIEARNVIYSYFTDSIDNRCYYEILCWGFQGEWEMSRELSLFQFCMEWGIVPEDILDMYIDECCFSESYYL